MKLASILHFCTNDARFLQKGIEELRKFSDYVVITVCDHFFNGEPENRALLDAIYGQFPDCLFLEYAFDSQQLYSPFHSHYNRKDREWGFLWHATSRWIGAIFSPQKTDALLFIDADEIFDGDRMNKWFRENQTRSYSGIRFRCYYYAKAHLRAREIFESALLVRRDQLDFHSMFHIDDRAALFRQLQEPKKRDVVDDKGEPFIHHYSWVRSKEECYCKSKSWGHRFDKNWAEPIERLFSDQTDPCPMDLPLDYYQVTPTFDPMQVKPFSITAPTLDRSNVLKIDRDLAFRTSLESL